MTAFKEKIRTIRKSNERNKSRHAYKFYFIALLGRENISNPGWASLTWVAKVCLK